MYSLSVTLISLFIFAQNIPTTRAIADLDICEPGKNDIIFLVDTSTSIQESCKPDQTTDNWMLIISFLKQIIGGFNFNTNPALRVGIIPFSTQVDNEFSSILSDNKSELLSRVEILKGRYYGGNTNISGALRQARLTFDNNRNSGRKQIIVLITDGQSNVDEELTQSTAKRNREANITHFVVAISPYVNRSELQEIIDQDPTFYYFGVELFENLNLTVQPLLERINCPKPNNNGCTEVKADICFLLDSSGSIVQNEKQNFTDWNSIKNFLREVVSLLKVGKDDNRISLIEFSNDARVAFYLNYSFSADVIKEKISKLENIGDTTNTQAALTMMYEDVFVAGKGDRPDVPNVGIVITDGMSTIVPENTIPAANISKSRGIRIFAIGLTSSIELKELNSIASIPTEQHVFTRDTISLVSTVVSNLIFNLCHQTCFTNCSTKNRCSTGEHLVWKTYNGKKIDGKDFQKIYGVKDVITCRNNCLQEQACRSIEYVAKFEICNLSMYLIKEVPANEFVDDETVQYNEWTCQ